MKQTNFANKNTLEPQEETPFELIQRFLKEFKGEINTINEPIDVSVQMEYFDASRKIRKNKADIDLDRELTILDSDNIELEHKKSALIKIAGIDDVKAFRSLENFVTRAESDIKDWALLALQESRMMLQSRLLEQSQVLISTGLGGKGTKLRYFFALFSRSGEAFADYQEKIVKTEFEFTFKQNDSEIEEINFNQNVATILALIPLNISIQDLFGKILNEINQYGNFLRENCIITNVRKMDLKEINDFLDQDKTENIE